MDDSQYYILSTDPNAEVLLSNLDPIGSVSWTSGQRFRELVPPPLRVTIQDTRHEISMLPSYCATVPMMRDDLLARLRENGIDNIDSYPVLIENQLMRRQVPGYSAVNIIGVIRVNDSDDQGPLRIDHRQVRGALLFRLAEAVSEVVVHERVKGALEATGTFPDLRFIHPRDWIG